MKLTKVSHITFLLSLERSRRCNKLIADMTSTSSVVKVGLTPEHSCYLTADLDAGFVIAPDGKFTSLFSIKPGRGAALITAAIKYGASYLYCFDGYLVTLYERFGFIEVDRIPDWIKGQPDGVFMELPVTQADVEHAKEYIEELIAQDYIDLLLKTTREG